MHKTDRGKKWPDHSSESALILSLESDLSRTDIVLRLGPGGQITFVTAYATLFVFAAQQFHPLLFKI